MEWITRDDIYATRYLIVDRIQMGLFLGNLRVTLLKNHKNLFAITKEPYKKQDTSLEFPLSVFIRINLKRYLILGLSLNTVEVSGGCSKSGVKIELHEDQGIPEFHLITWLINLPLKRSPTPVQEDH